MTSFNEQFNELVQVTLSGKQQLNNSTYDHENLEVMDKPAKRQDFSHNKNNNTIGKRYNTTRIKSRNFLSNIAYLGINKEDYYSESFVFDVYLLVNKNLNPFSLDRKLVDKSKLEMIYMLWK